MNRVLINPRLQWATTSKDIARLRYVPAAAAAHQEIPAVGQVLTAPFFVDPGSGQPTAVCVVELQYQDQPGFTLVIPIVERATSAP